MKGNRYNTNGGEILIDSSNIMINSCQHLSLSVSKLSTWEKNQHTVSSENLAVWQINQHTAKLKSAKIKILDRLTLKLQHAGHF